MKEFLKHARKTFKVKLIPNGLEYNNSFMGKTPIINYTHFYELNEKKWMQAHKGYFSIWSMNKTTMSLLDTIPLGKKPTLLYHDDEFCVVINFTDEELAVMDILR